MMYGYDDHSIPSNRVLTNSSNTSDARQQYSFHKPATFEGDALNLIILVFLQREVQVFCWSHQLSEAQGVQRTFDHKCHFILRSIFAERVSVMCCQKKREVCFKI